MDHDDRCSDFIFAFVHNLFPAPRCQAVSCFMKLLLGDAAVSTVIYFRKVEDFRLTINHIATDFSHLDNIIDVKPEQIGLGRWLGSQNWAPVGSYLKLGSCSWAPLGFNDLWLKSGI